MRVVQVRMEVGVQAVIVGDRLADSNRRGYIEVTNIIHADGDIILVFDDGTISRHHKDTETRLQVALFASVIDAPVGHTYYRAVVCEGEPFERQQR